MDLADRSIDEFFGWREEDSEQPRTPPRPRNPELDPSGFHKIGPRLNLRRNRVTLFIPSYRGGVGAKYEVTVEQDGRTIELGHLRVSPLDRDRSSLPTHFDLTDSEVSPLGGFVISIDGKKVYEMFTFRYMMFGPDGIPIRRAADETRVLYPRDKQLRLSDARLISWAEAGDLLIADVAVAQGGYVKVTNKPAGSDKGKDGSEEAGREGPDPTASIGLPQPEPYATVRDGDERLPIYPSAPDLDIVLKDAEGAGCGLTVNGKGATINHPASAIPEFGRADVLVTWQGRTLASVSFFVIPGFSCSYGGRGEIPESDVMTVTADGQEFQLSVIGDLDSPLRVRDTDLRLDWSIPAVSYDTGSGVRPFGAAVIPVDDLSDSIVVTARNVAKKAIFLSTTGKKTNITPDWEDDTIRIDSSLIEAAVFDSPTRSATLFITVNSCPLRQFLTVENQGRTEVSYSDGELRVDVQGAGQYECRLFGMDKSVRTFDLVHGENTVPVSDDTISAEVAEVRGGKEIAVRPVPIRQLPFLSRDMMGDVWLYVSKDKRIPLPDGLLEMSRDDPSRVRDWHSLITRMNPELRGVGPDLLAKAFAEFPERARAPTRGTALRPSLVATC